MSSGRDATRRERFAEFLRRLERVPAASSFEEAYRQLGDILNAVEDEMTSTPYDLASWRTDGRLYPPQLDREMSVDRPGVRQFRSVKHFTLIAVNGAIEIQEVSGQVVLSKAGSDGKHV
jgi:hypothetical protein